jgi:hypothetical protein
MNAKTLGLLTAALMAGPMAANAQYVYTYTGPDFDYIGPAGMPGNPYTTADHLTIQLVTSAPIPANLTTGASPEDFPGVALVSLTESDGVNKDTYTAAQLYHGQNQLSSWFDGFVNTNSAGSITNAFIYGQTVSTKTNYVQWTSDNGRDSVVMAPQIFDPEFVASAGFYGDEGNGKWTFAPEIDPASAAGGLTLLLSGLAMAMGARRSRSRESAAV